MKLPRVQENSVRASLWRITLCFLLAALFLYNPFLRSLRDAGGLAVAHPASHRATVGSSEMEQFAKRDGAVAPVPELRLAQAAVELLVAIPAPVIHTVDHETAIFPQSIFFASLWFRPPPAA